MNKQMGDFLEGKSHAFQHNTCLQACLFSVNVQLFYTVTHRHMVKAVGPLVSRQPTGWEDATSF